MVYGVVLYIHKGKVSFVHVDDFYIFSDIYKTFIYVMLGQTLLLEIELPLIQ